jgi:hypothetical protein
MSVLIFSLRANQDGTKLVPIDPDAISMSAPSPPSAAPRSLAVALQAGHSQHKQDSRTRHALRPRNAGSVAEAYQAAEMPLKWTRVLLHGLSEALLIPVPCCGYAQAE